MKILARVGPDSWVSRSFAVLFEKRADEILSLPIGPHLPGTEADQVVDGLSRATSAIDSEN